MEICYDGVVYFNLSATPGGTFTSVKIDAQTGKPITCSMDKEDPVAKNPFDPNPNSKDLKQGNVPSPILENPPGGTSSPGNVGKATPSDPKAFPGNPVTSSPAKPPANEDMVACTMDAKMCADGSFVSRQGPKCEFAPCPEEKKSK